MSSVSLFVIVPTATAVNELRRFVWSTSGGCLGKYGYHNAHTELDNVLPFELDGYDGYGRDDFPHDDPRWPKQCECGYVFKDEDQWQHNVHRLWRREQDDGSTFRLDKAPPGSLWDATWYHKTDWRGPDGRSACVMLPDGCDWLIDGPSKNSESAWQRSGEWPKITARPSILTPGYHGFLTDGVLVSC